MSSGDAGLIVGIIAAVLITVIGKAVFWVWVCHRWTRPRPQVIIRRNVLMQPSTPTMAPPVQTIMPGQYMPQGTQYGMPPGTQYGMPPGTQYGNPPAYYPSGSYGPPQVPVADGAPRSVDVDPRVDVSQKRTLVENE